MNRHLIIILSLTLAAGCQSKLMLMPTPEVLKDERINLFQVNPEPMTSNEISTLYVTTRVPQSGGSAFFKGTPDDELHFGYADLRIGEENLNVFELIDQSTIGERKEKFQWTMLDAPILSSTDRPSKEYDGDPTLHAEMAESMAALNEYIDSNPVKELTIYVHGASNTFYWSVAQGAQFQYFTGDNAMVLTFAWPSPGSIFGYGRDKRRSDDAATDLAYIIEILADHSTATRINLLAYSAGGRVIGGALEQLSTRHTEWESLRIGQVYLTQSDQPLIDFVEALPGFFPLVEGLTVTAAVGDPVLGMARMTDFQLRLGATGEGDGVNLKISDELRQQVTEIMNSERMVFIDLRNIPATEYSFTHGVWYENSWVSTDVIATLLGGYSAKERALEPTNFNGVTVYTFPEDYIERVTQNILTRAEANRRVQPEVQ